MSNICDFLLRNARIRDIMFAYGGCMDKNYIDMTNENCRRLNAASERFGSPLEEKELGSQKIYEGRIIDLRVDDVELPDGARSKREYVVHPGGAAVLPVDDEGFAYLVEQFRYPYREATLEIPAGKIEAGEDPLVTAARELEEETGLRAKLLTPLGVIYPTPGYTNEKLYICFAKGLEYVGEHPDQNEFLHVVRMPLHMAYEKIVRNEIKDGKTCYAIMRYVLLERGEDPVEAQ